MSQNNGPISRLVNQGISNAANPKKAAPPRMAPTVADYLLGRAQVPQPPAQRPPSYIENQHRRNAQAVRRMSPGIDLVANPSNERRLQIRANTPGTPENTRELVRRRVAALPIPDDLRAEVEALVDSALFIRTTYIDPETGMRRRVSPLAPQAAIRQTGLLDPEEAMGVVELLKTEEGIRLLLTEVEQFRARRRRGSQQAKELEALARPGNVDPNIAGVGGVIDALKPAVLGPFSNAVADAIERDPANVAGALGAGEAVVGALQDVGFAPFRAGLELLRMLGVDPEAIERGIRQFGQAQVRGFAGGVSSMTRIPQLLGSKEWADLSDAIDKGIAMREADKPLDKTFFNEIGRTIGGVIPQIAPALLTGGSSIGASVAGRMAASAVFGMTEAATNAAGGFDRAVKDGQNIEEARQRAFRAMPVDAIVSSVLNKLGAFGELSPAWKKMFASSFTEGLQETFQTGLEGYVATGGLDFTSPEAIKGGLLGMILGPLMGGGIDLATGTQMKGGAEAVPQRSAAASVPPVAEDYREAEERQRAREEQYRAWEVRQKELEELLERASGDTMLPNGMPNPMSKTAIQRMISEHRKSRPAFFAIGGSQPPAKPQQRTEPTQMPTRQQIAAMNVGAEVGRVPNVNALRPLQSEIDEWAAFRRNLGLESDPVQQLTPQSQAQPVVTPSPAQQPSGTRGESAVVETSLQDPQARAKAISESPIPGATEAAWSSGDQRIVVGVERIQDAISRVGTSPSPKEKDVIQLLTTMHQVRARAEAAGVDIDPAGELQSIEARMRDLGYEVDPGFMAPGDAYDQNMKAEVIDHIQSGGELRVHEQFAPAVFKDGKLIAAPKIITIGYSEDWQSPEEDGGNAAQLPPPPDSTLPPAATTPAEMPRQAEPQINPSVLSQFLAMNTPQSAMPDYPRTAPAEMPRQAEPQPQHTWQAAESALMAILHDVDYAPKDMRLVIDFTKSLQGVPLNSGGNLRQLVQNALRSRPGRERTSEPLFALLVEAVERGKISAQDASDWLLASTPGDFGGINLEDAARDILQYGEAGLQNKSLAPGSEAALKRDRQSKAEAQFFDAIDSGATHVWRVTRRSNGAEEWVVMRGAEELHRFRNPSQSMRARMRSTTTRHNDDVASRLRFDIVAPQPRQQEAPQAQAPQEAQGQRAAMNAQPPANVPEGVGQDATKKEPWQMTAREYNFGSNLYAGELLKQARDAGLIDEEFLGKKDGQGYAWSAHKMVVATALNRGLPVPPEVLADYPDLAAKYQPQNTPAKAPESVSPGVQQAEGSTAGAAENTAPDAPAQEDSASAAPEPTVVNKGNVQAKTQGSTGATPIAWKIVPIPYNGPTIHLDQLTELGVKAFGQGIVGTSATGTKGAFVLTSGTLYVKKSNDHITYAHEGAHRLDQQYKITDALIGSPAHAELDSGHFDHTVPANASAAVKMKEQFAAFMEAYVSDPSTLNTVAPNMVKAFEASVPKETVEAIRKFSEGLRRYAGQDSTAKVKGSFLAPVKPKTFTQMAADNVQGLVTDENLDAAAREVFDEYAPFVRTVDRMVGRGDMNAGRAKRKGERGITDNPNDLEVALREVPYTEQMLEDTIRKGMLNRLVSVKTGKTTRTTKSLLAILEPFGVRGKNQDVFMENWRDFEAYIASMRHLDFARRQTKIAAENVKNYKDVLAERLKQKKAAAKMRADSDLQAELLRIARDPSLTNAQRKAKERVLVDAHKARVARAYMRLEAGAKGALTTYTKYQNAEAKRRGEQSGIAVPYGVPGVDSTIRVANETIKRLQQDKKKWARLKQAEKDLREFSFTMIDNLEWAGILAPEQAQSIKDNNPYWFAIQRVEDPVTEPTITDLLHYGQSGLQAKNPVHALVGSSKSKQDVISALVGRVALTIDSAARNRVAQVTANWLNANGLPDGTDGEIIRVRKSDGIDATTPNTFKFYDHGQEVVWQVHPKNAALIDSLNRVGSLQSDKLDKMLWNVVASATTMTHRFIVSAPPFIAKNLFRDTKHRISMIGGNPLDTFLPKDKRGKEFKDAFGMGLGRSTVLTNRETYERNQRKAMKELTQQGNVIYQIGRGYHALQAKAEEANRLVVYKDAYKKFRAMGRTEYEADLLAFYAAREGMVDFKKAGVTARKVSRFIPFFNAAIAGQRTTGTQLRNNPGKVAVRMMEIAVVGIALEQAFAAMGGDDEEKRLESLSPYQREMFWNFRIGGDGGFWLSIPKGHEQAVGISMVERMHELARGREIKAGRSVTTLRDNTLPISRFEDVLGGWKALFEIGFNRSLYNMKTIVPDYERGLAMDARKGTQYASPVGQGMAGVFRFGDPRQWDHAIENMTGYYGRIVTELSEAKTLDEYIRASSRLTGLTMPGSPTQNEDVIAVDNLLSSIGVRPPGWDALKDSFYDAPDEASRQRAARRLISTAEQWRERLEPIMERNPNVRKDVAKQYLEAVGGYN